VESGRLGGIRTQKLLSIKVKFGVGDYVNWQCHHTLKIQNIIAALYI